ncbi:MAG: selenocysteine-specific translation elongation factor [Syntrophobacterales bacterium]|jgi:selenocysteine-specific elongation factor|nr:selenocysteine-specific translation elongation factor [Syntrophobacterales bacterium]
MKRIVVGTAGHIDHGKTALIRALTGIDCDRLKEEKERGITTELGFAHYRSGEDLVIGIVDVPGHEKFVRHMVAGAWGIDMVLLVVAADEGVMPQTREHVQICELLGLKRGIVAITKTDLADDDMVELVREDTVDFLKGGPLEGSPIIAVSAVTGQNIDVLKQSIRSIAMELQERSAEGIFRLPVDRVFTIRGLGTIITGTCISGSIRVGEEVEMYPLRRRVKVRSIQTYHEDASEASAGERVALNLQGVEKQEVGRGIIIGRPDTLVLSTRVDATLKYLKLPLKPIKNDAILRFHIATTLTETRLVLLDKDKIEPGEEAFTQFVFPQPIVTLPGDRYVLRGPYLIQTIGGGAVLDMMPGKHKRKAADLGPTCNLLTGDDIIGKAEFFIRKGGHGGIAGSMLAIFLGLDQDSAEPITAKLEELKKIRSIGRLIVHKDNFSAYKETLRKLVREFHEKNPVKIGISKEELRSRLPKVTPQVFQSALDECILEGGIETDRDKVKESGALSVVDREREGLETEILQRLKGYGLTPPGIKDFAAELKKPEKNLRDILGRLAFERKITKIKGEMYFHIDAMEMLKERITDFLRAQKEMTPSDFKSMFDLSRKYMIPILEHLDEIKLTIRVGDKRVLRG